MIDDQKIAEPNSQNNLSLTDLDRHLERRLASLCKNLQSLGETDGLDFRSNKAPRVRRKD